MDYKINCGTEKQKAKASYLSKQKSKTHLKSKLPNSWSSKKPKKINEVDNSQISRIPKY